MIVQTRRFSSQQLASFLRYQRTSFRIQTELASEITEGVTERQIARELVLRYRRAGAGNFFHLPVALFGERTALPGKWRLGHFFPRDVALRRGDPVILDASPLFDGFMVDTSYSFAFGENPEHAQMLTRLLAERQHILRAVNEGDTFTKIAQAVVQRGALHGYASVHEKHPGEVLGHRAVRVRAKWINWRIKGFDGVSLTWFRLREQASSWGLKRLSPLWNRSVSSDHPPLDGLWLVEPHFAQGGIGAKWEEIMVIEKGKARWLDDRPPHVARAVASS